MVIAEKFDSSSSFSEGLAAVGKLGGNSCNYTFIDKTGKLVIATKYNEAGLFSEGLSVVGRGNDTDECKYGLINKTGKVMLPFNYELIIKEEKGRTKVFSGDKVFFVDNLGKEFK